MLLVALVFMSLGISSMLLLFYTARKMTVNTWTRIAIMSHTVFCAYLYVIRWKSWSVTVAALFVGYFITTVLRTYTYIATDSLVGVVCLGIFFAVIDGKALAAVIISMYDGLTWRLIVFASGIGVQCIASLLVAFEQHHLINSGPESFGVVPAKGQDLPKAWSFARRSKMPMNKQM